MTDIVWTPWRDHGELLTVRRYLYVQQDGYGEAKDMRRKGCEIVSYYETHRKAKQFRTFVAQSSYPLTVCKLRDSRWCP